LRPELETLLFEAVGDNRDERYGASLDDADLVGQTLLVRYSPALTADAYVRSEVRIECGAKSALDRHVNTTIRPYVADDLPDLDFNVADVITIQPMRTFWDKVVKHRTRLARVVR
jgi:Nucleotidyl transferase AbiEii toxin, Type IV TA system